MTEPHVELPADLVQPAGKESSPAIDSALAAAPSLVVKVSTTVCVSPV
jgi:hypothetical protein